MFESQGFGHTQYPQYPQYGEHAAVTESVPPPTVEEDWGPAEARLRERTRAALLRKIRQLEAQISRQEAEKRKEFLAREQEAILRRDREVEQREKVAKSWRQEAQGWTFNESFEQDGSEGSASPTGVQMVDMRKEELSRDFGIVNPSQGMLEHSVRRPGGIPVGSVGSVGLGYSGFANSPDHSDDENPSAPPPPRKPKKHRESLITDLRRQGIDDPEGWLRKQQQISQSTYGRSQSYDGYNEPSTSAGPSRGRNYSEDSRVHAKKEERRSKREKDGQGSGKGKGRGDFEEEEYYWER